MSWQDLFCFWVGSALAWLKAGWVGFGLAESWTGWGVVWFWIGKGGDLQQRSAPGIAG